MEGPGKLITTQDSNNSWKDYFPIAGPFLIFLGVLRLMTFFSSFGIRILDFLDFSEIITSFFDFLSIMTILFIIIILYAFISTKPSLEKDKQTWFDKIINEHDS